MTVNVKLDAIRQRFNRSAEGSYDKHAVVQQTMAESLAELLTGNAGLSQTESPAILEIGCGTGALTVKLRSAWPLAEITALDLAPAMLEAAKRRLDAAVQGTGQCRERFEPNTTMLLADAEEWALEAASGAFDLIVSSACFQWLARPQQTLRELKRLLRPGGTLAFTTFGAQTFHELHAAFEAAYNAQGMEPQRHGLPLRTAEEWLGMLTEAGFHSLRHNRMSRTELYPTVRDFLHAVKSVGASASAASASSGIGKRRLFADMFRHYETLYGCPDGIPATYELLLLHGFAPE